MTMMPRLEARERIARAEDVALGGGSLTEEVERDLMESLSARARGPQRSQRVRRADLAGMGIGVRVSPPKTESKHDG